MGKYCEFCKTKKQKVAVSGISFHRFPKDQEQARLWIKNMGRENWQPHEFSVLCSSHFTPDCFIKHYNRSTLHAARVPTLFDNKDQVIGNNTAEILSTDPIGEASVTSNRDDVSMEMTTESPSAEGSINREHDVEKIFIAELKHEEDLSPCPLPTEAGPSQTAVETSTLTATPKRHQYFNHDHNYEDEPRITAKKLHLTRQKLLAHKGVIRALRQRVKRLNKTVTSLKDVIRKLKEISRMQQNTGEQPQRLLASWWSVLNEI